MSSSSLGDFPNKLLIKTFKEEIDGNHLNSLIYTKNVSSMSIRIQGAIYLGDRNTCLCYISSSRDHMEQNYMCIC